MQPSLPRKYSVVTFLLAVLFSLLWCTGGLSSVTGLRARGYVIVPAPRQVELGARDVAIGNSWSVEVQAGVDGFAADWLKRWAGELAGLRFEGGGGGRIILRVVPGTVSESGDPALDRQGYRLAVFPDSVVVTGNSAQGLFYGVCSLVQLIRRDTGVAWSLPECAITDWPDLELRFAHKDTKLHQELPQTLKRHFDWLALMKVNCVAFDLDDRFEYPSHPAIGIPGAYTTEQMQDFSRYALQRHIQFVPDMQSPAHFNWALKHPQFAGLRSDGNNYQACLCDEDAIRLIQDLYADLIEATPGVEYFHMAMDEVYYAGICEKCGRQYNNENRSLAWAEYVNRMYPWLTERGRRVLAWVEYPLLPEHIRLLPRDLIDGVLGDNRAFVDAENEIGMRQLIYTSMQGVELLFPNYFPATYRGDEVYGRLDAARKTIIEGRRKAPRAIGSFAAYWDASGPHEEAAWLGWATVNQYAWSTATPSLDQHVEDFFDFFHGRNRPDMTAVYKMLIEQARFFESGWDRVPSITRGPSYGNSEGKGVGTRRYDYLLPPPGLPRPGDLRLESSFSDSHAALIDSARVMLGRNANLRSILTRSTATVERNRYSLEVFLAVAGMAEYFIRTVITMADAEGAVRRAAESHAGGDFASAGYSLARADRLVAGHQGWGREFWGGFKEVWERSRYPKGRSVDGREYVFVGNDTKDLWADRTPDMEFMVAPFARIGLDRWRVALAARAGEYARAHELTIEMAPAERQDN
ncbi:MAG: family 20 glycosylhydrolase [Candidatus Glassbacteria bacterium]|nr:family 20 glycosylhydrolase [Candidatus Glassbacteria bacterium]